MGEGIGLGLRSLPALKVDFRRNTSGGRWRGGTPVPEGLRECFQSPAARGAGLPTSGSPSASQTVQTSGSNGGGAGRLLQDQPSWKLETSGWPSPVLSYQATKTPSLSETAS